MPRQQFFDERDPEVIPLAEAALALIAKMTAGQREIQLPSVIDVNPSLVRSEAYAYHRKWFSGNPNLYQVSMRRFLEQGARTSGADYALAVQEVSRLRREIGKVFADVDLIVTSGRKRLPRKIEDVVKTFGAETPPPPDIGVTQQFSVYGLPAMSVPCGFTKDGLPVGIQIIGPHWGEGRVFALGHAFEQATDWHKRRPPLDQKTDILL